MSVVVTTNDLERMILLGEDSYLELKDVLLSGSRIIGPRRKKMADIVAGMANSRGGTIVLGVDDKTRDVIGILIESLDAVVGWITEICLDSLQPPINASIRRLELPGSSGCVVPVILVDVPRSLFLHESPGGFYDRVGSSNRRLTPDVLARLLHERSQTRFIRFDESAVPGSRPEDLDSQLTARFLRKKGENMSPEIIHRLRLIVRDEPEASYLTVTGALMCTRSPERWLPHAYIQAVRYSGERRDINYQLDARDLTGPLDQQVTEGLRFVRRNAVVRATKGTVRIERPQYSERAVFEALVNAVAHRDYSMAGARIRLHMFDNRIELYVPGALANTLTVDSMADRQYCRNELIVSLLARCPIAEGDFARQYMMERRGDGVRSFWKRAMTCPDGIPSTH